MPFAAELPFAFYAIAAFVFGLLVGSFLNVVIWRVPRGESIIFPGSHCGSCGAPVKPYDNIPLISYAVLRGKCRACKTHFSLIYPAVELLTGLLFLAIFHTNWSVYIQNFALIDYIPNQLTFPLPRIIAEMIFVAILIALTFIDAKHQLLPNVITYPALLFSLCAAGVIACNPLYISPWLPAVQSVDELYSLIYGPTAFPYNKLGRLIAGPLALACAVPTFWLIDRIDDVLFGKYFESGSTEDSEPEAEDPEIELRMKRQHQVVSRVTMIIGIAMAVTWIFLTILPDMFFQSEFYWGMLHAAFGALIGGGVIWLLRAAYFWSRGFEGMGLGDVKLMAVIGAFLGWQSAILVIILASLLGSIVGLVLARKSKDGMKTALPFGVFLGPAAIFALFFGQSVIQWYAGRFS